MVVSVAVAAAILGRRLWWRLPGSCEFEAQAVIAEACFKNDETEDRGFCAFWLSVSKMTHQTSNLSSTTPTRCGSSPCGGKMRKA